MTDTTERPVSSSNDVVDEAASGLSGYLHWGHVGVHQVLDRLAGQMHRGIDAYVAIAEAHEHDDDRPGNIRAGLTGYYAAELADHGRIVLRASGTEPVIRVMVEGKDEAQVVSLAERLASILGGNLQDETHSHLTK